MSDGQEPVPHWQAYEGGGFSFQGFGAEDGIWEALVQTVLDFACLVLNGGQYALLGVGRPGSTVIRSFSGRRRIGSSISRS